MKPKILLSGNERLQNYVDAIEKCGAEAVAEYLPEISTEYDGLILCGGADIDPKRYAQEIDGSVNIDYKRDEVEFKLIDAFVKAEKPIMGICRGHQLINIYFGGTLNQDIFCANKHKRTETNDRAHSVKATKNSICYRLYGEDFWVNSAHHQAIDKLADTLVATAYSEENIIEATQHISLPIFSVQWHPERMCFLNKRNDTVDGRLLFDYFIKTLR